MKKTIILTLAALMTVSVSSAVASAIDAAETSAVTDRKPAKKKKGEIKEVIFMVDLDCESCVKKVTENISFERGVKDLNVSLAEHTVAIKYDDAKTSEATLKAAIEKLGYKVGEEGHEGHDHGSHDGHDHGSHEGHNHN